MYTRSPLLNILLGRSESRTPEDRQFNKKDLFTLRNWSDQDLKSQQERDRAGNILHSGPEVNILALDDPSRPLLSLHTLFCNGTRSSGLLLYRLILLASQFQLSLLTCRILRSGYPGLSLPPRLQTRGTPSVRPLPGHLKTPSPPGPKL